MSILIRNVIHGNQKTNVYIESSVISYIGPEEKQAEHIIEGDNKAIFPSLVNSHTHAAMTLFRGYGDDMRLQEWLETKIWPLEAKLTPEDVYWGTKLACLEMIKSGTTLFNDMYWHVHSTAKAVEEMGIRAVLSTVFLDFFDADKAKEQMKRAEQLVDEFQQYSSDHIRLALGPHALYSVSGEALSWIRNFSEEHDLLVHFHLSETEKEVLDCLAQHKKRPAKYLDDLGFLGPNLVAAHGVWLDEEELDILAQRQVSLVHNPLANFKLAVGKIFPYQKARQSNIRICLGTDGCASNNNLDIFEELKFSALAQKWQESDTTVMPCHETWGLMQQAYEVLRFDAGKIEVGKLADVILVDLKHPQMVPCHDIISNLVYSANGSVVDTVICGGKILMQNRSVPGEQEIIAKAQEIAQDLVQRK